jgi:ubiquinol-cytochrome c reductase cytochrome c1 subunit
MLEKLITLWNDYKSPKFLIPFAVAGGFSFALLMAILTGALSGSAPWNLPEQTAVSVYHEEPRALSLASNGPFGRFDQAQLQRGFHVYQQVCSSCHSMHMVSFYDLKALGYNNAEVKAIAKNWSNKQPVMDAKTLMASTRDNIISDRIPKVAYAGTGNPPDLSLITKAREGGAAYIYSLLTGYKDMPNELAKRFPSSVPAANAGLYYNPYFSNLFIAMPQQLHGGEVTNSDGTPNTADQEAKDVSAFLVWAAEPKLENRHVAGISAVFFLMALTILFFLSYKQILGGKKK